MVEHQKSMFNYFKNNMFSLYDTEISNLSPIKGHNKSMFDTNTYNNTLANQINQINLVNKNGFIKPLIKEKSNNDIDNQGKIRKTNSFNKIIQKEIILNNNMNNINTRNKKKIAIKNIPINTINNNYCFKINNLQNDAKPQKENRIKNIHISLKKIKLGDQRNLSKNKSSKIIQTYVYKSPKRNIKISHENNLINKENISINTSYNNSQLLSKINISAKKNNIPRPNIKNEIIRNKINRYNFLLGKKKIDKKLLDQSQEIKKKFKQEKENIKRKNEFFDKNGILSEEKITYENKVIKIQSHLRKFFQMKKVKKAKNKSFENRICKVNEIIIFSQKNEKANNNKFSLIYCKYILKYLLIKKDQKRINVLQKFFNKFKNQTMDNLKPNKKIQIKLDNKIKTNNICEMRNKILKELVEKKINKNKDTLHRSFLHYYYNTFYININWYIYYMNLLTYAQKIDIYNISNNTNKGYLSLNSTEKHMKSSSIILYKDQNYLSESLNDLKKIMNKICETISEELKIFYLNEIIRKMNKINIKQEKLEKEKYLKNFIFVLFSIIKKVFNNNYNRFFYKILLIKSICNNEENRNIRKNKYLKRIIQKNHKEILQKNFNKFIIRTFLSYLPKYANISNITDDRYEMNIIQLNNNTNINHKENKKEIEGSINVNN